MADRSDSWNGVGPWWFPAWARAVITRRFLVFFREASPRRHDAGYRRGRPARWICDLKFLGAMVRDASRAPSAYLVAKYVLQAFLYWAAVRAFGWASYGRGAGR